MSTILARSSWAQDDFHIMFWPMQVPMPLKTGPPSSTFILFFALEQLPDASLWQTLCFSRGIQYYRQQTCLKTDIFRHCKYWIYSRSWRSKHTKLAEWNNCQKSESSRLKSYCPIVLNGPIGRSSLNVARSSIENWVGLSPFWLHCQNLKARVWNCNPRHAVFVLARHFLWV